MPGFQAFYCLIYIAIELIISLHNLYLSVPIDNIRSPAGSPATLSCLYIYMSQNSILAIARAMKWFIGTQSSDIMNRWNICIWIFDHVYHEWH